MEKFHNNSREIQKLALVINLEANDLSSNRNRQR
ncbi:MAG: hypothetical protein EZS28_050510, partial [Streblomastix strix]